MAYGFHVHPKEYTADVRGFSFVIEKDGDVYRAYKSGKGLTFEDDDASEVINAIINALPSGGKIALCGGEFIFSKTVEWTDGYYVIVGSGWSTKIIPPSGEPAFKFRATNVRQKVLFRDLRFEASELQDAVHIVDCSKASFENVWFYQTRLLMESIDYWCENLFVSQSYFWKGGIKFLRTGGTGSWAQTRLDHVMFTEITEGVTAIEIVGGSMYRSFLWLTIALGGGTGFKIDGNFYGNYVYLADEGSGTLFDIVTTDGKVNENYIVFSDKVTTTINNPNARPLGIFSLRNYGTYRIYKDPEIGVNDVYGAESILCEYVPIFPKIRIVVGGTFATDETVTVKIEAEYGSGTRSVEKSFTATGSYDLTNNDLISLIPFGAENPLKVSCYAKSNQASTDVTVRVHAILSY